MVYNIADVSQGVCLVNIRSLAYWIISIMTLLCCLLAQTGNTSKKTITPKNISSSLQVEPKFIYYSGGKYQINLVGELRMDLLTDSIGHKLLDYDALIIDSLVKDYSTDIYLNWHVNNQPHKQLLNHGRHSINPIDFKTNDLNEIKDIHLLITSDMELGSDISRVKKLYFNSIYLDSMDNQNSFSVNFYRWMNFTPIKIKSINGYSSSNDLNMSSFLYRLMLWLTITIGLYFLFKVDSKHIIYSLTLAWFIAAIPFSLNFFKQHKQISGVFQHSSEYINKTDKDMFHLADSIQTDIKKSLNMDINQNRFIILGANDFAALRLFYHLSGLNVAISSSIKTKEKKNNHIIYILINGYMNHCNTQNKTLALLSQQTDYCLAVLR
jgi:hypothetical protein